MVYEPNDVVSLFTAHPEARHVLDYQGGRFAEVNLFDDFDDWKKYQDEKLKQATLRRLTTDEKRVLGLPVPEEQVGE